MKTLRFNNNDTIPVMGLGTWLSKPNEVYNAIIEAIKVGYRHIDCAYIYGNEVEIGKALQDAFKQKLVKREELFITSKLWNSYHSPEVVEKAIKQTLKDLQLDYLDLYLMHWPIAFRTGKDNASSAEDVVSLVQTPLSETWKAMNSLKKKGFTKHIGVSNFSIHKLNELINKTNIVPEMNQVELHPYLQQNELVEYCHQQKILVTAYSPLGGKLMRGGKGLDKEKVIIGIAKKHQCEPSQVLLAWGMERDTIVIPKSTNNQRIKNNFDSVNVKLDKEDMDKIATLDRDERLSNGAFSIFPGGYYTLKNIWDE